MDQLDQAKQLEQLARQVAIDNIKNSDIETEQPDEEDGIRYCLDCADDIDEARLKARPSAVRCVGCQNRKELRNKAYR